MSNIVEVQRGVSVDEGVIDAVKAFYEGVMSGEITELAIVGRYRGGQTLTTFHAQDSTRLTGSVEYLKVRIINKLLIDRECGLPPTA